MMRLFWFLNFVLMGAVYFWVSAPKSHHLDHVPPSLKVSEVLYVAEEFWGPGPGGKETGIIVYEMPVETQDMIDRRGVKWLNRLLGSGSDWRGIYRNWHRTPFDPSVRGAFDIWAVEKSCGHDGGIAGYMFRGGLCIPFDKEYEKLANQALSSPGSFYAFGRIGMLLLIPNERRIIYAFNG